MERNHNIYRISLMAECLKVSRSGYYAYISRRINIKSNGINNDIKQQFLLHKTRLGAPKMYYHLQDLGYKISMRTVGRYMHNMNLSANNRRKFKYNKHKNNTSHTCLPNMLERNFKANYCNRKWVSDITYLATKQGWCYLCVI
jgi:putative transposase